MMIPVFKKVENIVGKGENADSKLKAFADEKINVAQMMIPVSIG